MKSGDKVIAWEKNHMGSFEDILSSEGKRVGLLNILPVTGVIGNSNFDYYVNLQLDDKFLKYFIFRVLAMNKSDIQPYNIINNFKDEDFII